MLVSYLNNLNPYQELTKFDQLLVGVPADLTSKEALPELQIRAALGVKYSQFGPAYKLFKRLQGELFKQNQETKDRYEPIMVWLQYAAMPDLTTGELVDFFKQSNFTVILKDEDFNDLAGMLRLRLSLEDINERDGWREKIYNALHENKKIVREFSGFSGRTTTVADWFKLYDSVIGLEPAKSIAIAEFNNQNMAAFKLDDNGKDLWKRLVDFYEYVKLSSSDPLGLEEDVIVAGDKGAFLLSNGEQMDLSRVESELKPIGAAAVFPPQPPRERLGAVSAEKSALDLGPIAATARALLLQTKGETKTLRDRLSTALSNSDRAQGLALLLLLAQLRQLDNLLSDDERSRAVVVADLKASGQDDMVEGLRLNPTAPNFIARFLKVVLQDKLGLPEVDALYFAEKLGLVLAVEGEKYSKIAIDDGRGGKKWNL